VKWFAPYRGLKSHSGGPVFLLLLLRGYQRWLSPLLPAACRYLPTCSNYAMEAIATHGALYGSWLAARRLLRCHPLGRGGYDPVSPAHPAARGARLKRCLSAASVSRPDGRCEEFCE